MAALTNADVNSNLPPALPMGNGPLLVAVDNKSLPVSASIDTTGLATSAKQDTQVTTEQAIQAALGATNGAAVITDANGTLQQYLRGLVKILSNVLASEYETVAASQTDQALGATGAAGDYLGGVLIVPATTSPGAVSIKDGGGPSITIFTGGASSVSNLVPFFVPLGIISASGAWKVTTGANVSAIGVGNFT